LLRAVGVGNVNKLVADKTAAGWSSSSVMLALNDLQQLVSDKDFVAGYSASKWPAIQQKWAAGQASFLYLGSWVPNEASAYAPAAFKYATFNFPALSAGGDTAVPTALNGFAVIGKAKNQTAAEKFIAYFMQKSEVGKITSVAKTLTPRSDVTPPPQLADMEAIISANSLAPVNDGIGADFPDFDTNVFQPLCAKLMTGQISAAQFASDVQQQQVQYWKLHG
jgi:raffinose/stachyose/melibiose transport system substrate-binding protein